MGPVQAAVEMNSTPDRTVKTLRSIPDYVQKFKEAFPHPSDAAAGHKDAGSRPEALTHLRRLFLE